MIHTDLSAMPTLAKVYGTLTTIQSASAVIFSSFLVIHGVQVAAATFGGPEASNRLLLLGRPVYQDEHTEGLLVTGSVIVHVASGLGKAGIRWCWDRSQKNKKNNKEGRSSSNTVQGEGINNNNAVLFPYHRAVGYLIGPALYLHFDLVRSLPRKYFGDSSMVDFSHIAWGLQNYPVVTYGLHSILIGTVAYHLVGGMPAAVRRTFKPKSKKPVGPSCLMAAVLIGSFTFSGMLAIGRQTRKIPLRHDYAQIYQSVVPAWLRI